MNTFAVRGFNLCESILRHSPEQLRTFIRRMKNLRMNTLIVHYDYGWKRYHELIMEECAAAGVEITLMTFGPRTFFAYTPWKKQWFAKNQDGIPFSDKLECETFPCRFEAEALAAYHYGAERWLKSLPLQIKRVHMRASDGLMFCQCEKCRPLLDHEKWQPFIEIFMEAVANVRSDLAFETDVYVRRYNIPENQAPFQSMSRIMYDTFYRHPFYPIGSEKDVINRENLLLGAATEKNPDAPTPNSYHLNRLKEWTTAFPGKTYIHENAMGQSLFGTFQHNTGVLLKDQRLYRKLNVQGICYEAYEPGYSGFEDMFKTLSTAMIDPNAVDYEPSALETCLTQSRMRLFCDEPDFPLEKYISDPFQLRQASLYREFQCALSPVLFRKYLDFAFEFPERLDPLMIGFGIAKAGLVFRKIRFENLSPEAKDCISRRKLWDFMEDIPLTESPLAVCWTLLEELYGKAEI